MNATLTALTALGALLAIATLAGVVWANLRSSALEASNKRLEADNQYYVRKITYLEPKVEALETAVAAKDRENETLRELHNPTAKLEQLRRQEKENHEETFEFLKTAHADAMKHLEAIAAKLNGKQP